MVNQLKNCFNEVGCSLCRKYELFGICQNRDLMDACPDNCFCCCCCDYECCCCCCCEYKKEDFNKNNDFFCYCYKAHRKFYWCDKFITNDAQKKIVPFMIEYFFLRLLTIAFEKQYENYKGKKEHIKTRSSVFILSFFLFLYLSLSLSRLSGSYGDDDTKENKNEKRFQRDLISKLSNGILDGVHAILFFNGVFSFIFSVLYLSSKLEYIFEDNVNVIFIPILINKFYLLTLNYYCAYTSEENKNDELISNSTLISLYMGIWD